MGTLDQKLEQLETLADKGLITEKERKQLSRCIQRNNLSIHEAACLLNIKGIIQNDLESQVKPFKFRST